ncbi:karyopherin [Mycoemilia scoparia]|uniref:Karyopherin n=1 Tax=Mycoemilia scoparia TaxID=417184 RepID=A0A9W8DQ34_9FUNG|nr:karyopherin [Mycoemilia scoparia]
MSSEALNAALAALKTVYSLENISQSARQQAQDVCELFKNSPQAHVHGVNLVNKESGYSDIERHFGLLILEHTIKYKWGWKGQKAPLSPNHLDEGAQTQLRDRIMDLMMSGLREDGTEAKFVEEKMVSLVVSVIVRMWPGPVWENLNTQLVALYNTSSAKRRLALLIFRRLGESVLFAENDPIVELRHLDLTTGLTSLLFPAEEIKEKYPQGIRINNKRRQAIKVWIEPNNEMGWFLRWAELLKQLGPSNANEKDMLELLNCISVYIGWLPVSTVKKSKIIYILSDLLGSNDNDIRIKAITCIGIVSTRPLPKKEDQLTVVEEIIDSESGYCLRALQNSYMATLKDTEDPDEAIFARHIANVLSGLSRVQLANKKSQAWIPKNFAAWTELMLNMQQDSRAGVVYCSTAFWISVYESQELSSNPVIASSMGSVMTIFTQKWLWALDTIDQINAKGEDADYPEDETSWDNVAEYKLFVESKVRDKCQQVVSLLARKDVGGMCQWLCDRLVETVNSSKDGNESLDLGLKSNPHYQNQLEIILQLIKSMALMIKSKEREALVLGDDSVLEATAMAKKHAVNVLTLVVQLHTPSVTKLINIQCQIMVSYSFILKDPENEALLNGILEKLTSYIRISPGPNSQENNGKLSTEYDTIITKALSSLVSLAESIPEELMKYYDQWLRLTDFVMSQSPNFTSLHHNMMIDFHLALAGNARLSVVDRKKLALPAIQKVMETWQGTVSSMASLGDLMSILGLPELDGMFGGAGVEALKSFFAVKDKQISQIINALTMLNVALSRTTKDATSTNSMSISEMSLVWGDVISELTSSLLHLIRLMHALWNSSSWGNQSWRSKEAQSEFRLGVLGLPFTERAQIIRDLVKNNGPSDNSSDNAGRNRYTKLINKLRSQDFSQLSVKPEEQGEFIQRSTEAVSSHISNCIMNILMMSYKCFSKLTLMPQIFHIPDFTNVFVQSMFSDIQTLPLRHMGILLSELVVPVLNNVPSDATERLVSSFLPTLFNFMQQRIKVEWDSLQARGLALTSRAELEELAMSDQSSQGETDVSDDIIQEKVVRTWTGQWARIVLMLLDTLKAIFPDPEEIKKDLEKLSSSVGIPPSETKEYTKSGLNLSLGKLLLSSAELMGGLLSSASQLVTTKDLWSVTRSLLRLGAVVPQLAIASLVFEYQSTTGGAKSINLPYLRVLDQKLAFPILGWISGDLATSLMALLQDVYFEDVYGRALTLLGDIAYYSTTFDSLGWKTLSADQTSSASHLRLGLAQTITRVTGRDSSSIEQVVRRWSLDTESKSRKAIGRLEFQDLMGVDKGQMFKTDKKILTGKGAASGATLSINYSHIHDDQNANKFTKKGDISDLFSKDSGFNLDTAIP